jgi:dTDP-glucose 4,6-dehydratase
LKEITGQRILITGGAGFIGSHLAERLLNQRNKIIVIDNLLTGSLLNLEKILNHKDFEFINHNVSEYIKIHGNLDWVMHFASPASPTDFERLAIPILKVGSLGTHNALGLALEKKAKFFLASTSEVYGDPEQHPQPETYYGNVNPIGPRGVYDESKRFAEAITMAYHRKHGVDTRIVRIFNTYGPRMRANDGRVVCTFIKQALNGEDLTVFGTGKQSRSFQYIDDLVEGIVRLMGTDFHEPVNIGNPNEFTILELAEKLIKMLGSNSGISYKALPQDDPLQRQPDISRARELLNWEPKIELEEGIERSLPYFKEICLVKNKEKL